jgi:hypothetical protein
MIRALATAVCIVSNKRVIASSTGSKSELSRFCSCLVWQCIVLMCAKPSALSSMASFGGQLHLRWLSHSADVCSAKQK